MGVWYKDLGLRWGVWYKFRRLVVGCLVLENSPGSPPSVDKSSGQSAPRSPQGRFAEFRTRGGRDALRLAEAVGALLGPGKGYWEALSWSARIARALSVRSSCSLDIKRRSPLTHRLPFISISVMRIFSPRSVMGMPPATSIAFRQSLMDILGGAMRNRASAVRHSCW